MARHDLLRAAERTARRQHGIITRGQALSIGFSARAVDRLVASGSWVRLAPSVYALAAYPPTWQRQYIAAQLSISEGSVAGLAAGALLGFETFRVVRPELFTTHTGNHRSPLATVHRADGFLTTTSQGIQVTTPAQTLADVVTRVRLDRWERACDDQLLKGKVTIDQLQERVAHYEGRRRRGIATLRALVDDRSADGWAPTESELEQLLRNAVALVPGCPTVVWQAALPWGDPGEGRLDGYIPAWRTVLEADGRRWHARMAAFDADRWRDNEATAVGLSVLRFTWAHLAHRVDECVDVIARTGAYRRQPAA
jgi:hypothetical protein